MRTVRTDMEEESRETSMALKPAFLVEMVLKNMMESLAVLLYCWYKGEWYCSHTDNPKSVTVNPMTR